MAFALLRHAIRLVLTNWREAVKISAVLYIMQAGFAAVIALGFRPVPGVVPEPGTSLLIIAAAILQGILSVWIAVAWHRFVLLDEVPNNYVPLFKTSRVLSYFGGGLLLGVVGAGIGIVGLVAIGVFGALGATVVEIPLGIVLFVVFVVVGYRLSLILPAASVDRRLSLRDSWTATRGTTWLVVRLTLLTSVCLVVLDLPVFLLGGPADANIATQVWGAIIGWIGLMGGVALLTTMYGYYVEGRPIEGMPPPPGAEPPAIQPPPAPAAV